MSTSLTLSLIREDGQCGEFTTFVLSLELDGNSDM